MRSRFYFLILLSSWLLLLAACGPGTARIEPGNLFWPLPPDQPRIKYVRSIYSEDDIGRIYSFKEKLFGKDYIDVLGRPYGMYARNDKIYVTDLLLRSLLIFDLTEKRMFVVGSREGLRSPSSVVADAAGNVYIADAAASKIIVYDAKHSYKTSFRIENSRPVALAINDALGRLYVVDRANHEVHVLDLAGKELFTFGGTGKVDGKFNIPLAIAIDRSGKVYVLDNGNFRVQIFDANGRFQKKFGAVGDLPGQFANPKGIAVDSEGHIYVTDGAFSNFQIFDQEGRILMYVGELGLRPGQFHLPGQIAIGDNDRIYVADQMNKRIEVFQYLKAP